MAFVIVTDSASDFGTTKENEKYHMHIIPTPVTIDGKDYFDGKDLFPDEFYKLQEEEHDIKTYHVSQYMFHENFEPYAKRGDEVLYLCFSTGIAGTYNAARLAYEELQEEYPGFKMTIIDTKCASLGFGLIAYYLLQMQENGAPNDVLIEAASYFSEHMKHIIAVKTLEYLHKGGRMSKTAAVAGTMLDIKPIIRVNEEGALEATEKVRGWKKALKREIEILKEEGADLDHSMIAICHGQIPEDVELSIGWIREQFPNVKILQGRIGCAIGAHTGPGIVGIVFQDAHCEKYDKYLNL